MGQLFPTAVAKVRHHPGGVIIDLAHLIHDLILNDGSLDPAKIEWRVEHALRRTASVVHDPPPTRFRWSGIKQNVAFQASLPDTHHTGMKKKKLTTQDATGHIEVVGGEWVTHMSHTPQHLLRELKNAGLSEQDALMYRMRSFKVTYWTERTEKSSHPNGAFMKVEVLVHSPDTHRPEPVTNPEIYKTLAKDLLLALGERV
jgi:hypothetical protein